MHFGSFCSEVRVTGRLKVKAEVEACEASGVGGSRDLGARPAAVPDLGARRLQLAEAAVAALAELRATCKLRARVARRRAASQAAASVLRDAALLGYPQASLVDISEWRASR